MPKLTKDQREAEYLAQQASYDQVFDENRHRFLLDAVAAAFNYSKASLDAGFGEAGVTFEEAYDGDGMPFFRLVVESAAHYTSTHSKFGVRMTDRMKRLEFESSFRELEQEVEYLRALAVEQKRKDAVRSSALAKLSREERELLGV